MAYDRACQKRHLRNKRYYCYVAHLFVHLWNRTVSGRNKIIITTRTTTRRITWLKGGRFAAERMEFDFLVPTVHRFPAIDPVIRQRRPRAKQVLAVRRRRPVLQQTSDAQIVCPFFRVFTQLCSKTDCINFPCVSKRYIYTTPRSDFVRNDDHCVCSSFKILFSIFTF